MFPTDQPNVGLVDEGRGLERMVGTLPGHVHVGKSMEFPIYVGRELFQGLAIAVSPGSKQIRKVLPVRHGHAGDKLTHPRRKRTAPKNLQATGSSRRKTAPSPLTRYEPRRGGRNVDAGWQELSRF
jgi:hypothetical protein